MFAERVEIEALAEAFKALRGTLLSYLRKRVADANTAEDLLQEVFVKASAAGASKRLPANITGWLYAVARNVVVDFYRAKRPMEALVDDDLPADGPADDILQQELAACLRPLVQRMPEIYRDTLLATDFEGRTMQSVAAERGVSLSAIKSRASRARRLLKENLLECCHVEVSGSGAVSDYHLRSPSKCGSGCG